MKKYIKFIILGTAFGVILTKSEVISWYRIYEMFKFQSFHMYGIIGSAVVLSTIIMQLFKKGILKDYKGNFVKNKNKDVSYKQTLIGGTIFGLGWALAGSCPGPIFALIGYGITPFILVLIGALTGTLCYGILSKKLPK